MTQQQVCSTRQSSTTGVDKENSSSSSSERDRDEEGEHELMWLGVTLRVCLHGNATPLDHHVPCSSKLDICIVASDRKQVVTGEHSPSHRFCPPPFKECASHQRRVTFVTPGCTCFEVASRRSPGGTFSRLCAAASDEVSLRNCLTHVSNLFINFLNRSAASSSILTTRQRVQTTGCVSRAGCCKTWTRDCSREMLGCTNHRGAQH